MYISIIYNNVPTTEQLTVTIQTPLTHCTAVLCGGAYASEYYIHVCSTYALCISTTGYIYILI